MLLPVLAALALSASPGDVPNRAEARFTWRLSVGSFLGSVWAAPSFRDNVERFKVEQLEGLRAGGTGAVFDSQYLIYTAPVLGPWLTLIRGGQQAREDMWMLVTSGVLQAVGITALTWRVLNLPAGSSAGTGSEGLVLDVSPYVAGRLGLALTLTGW